MSHRCNVYLDIETTGLSSYYNEITVIGIYREDSTDERLIQLVGGDATKDNLLEVLDGVDKIFTYNGNRFDIPFIHNYLGVNLAAMYPHHDLMYDCWKNNLYGGFKAVEQQLGIRRQLKDVNGFEAVKLWWRYRDYSDHDALATLLAYNREDVVNLKVLREILWSHTFIETGKRDVI
jgi:uncharacterized protein YprB with RNaseH-like and TPR domain